MPWNRSFSAETVVEQRLHLHRLRLARGDGQVFRRGCSLVRVVLEEDARQANVRARQVDAAPDRAGDHECLLE